MKHIKIYEDYMNEGKYELNYDEGSKPDSVLVTNAEDDEEIAEIDSKGKITWFVKGLPASVKKNIEAAAEYHVDTLNESSKKNEYSVAKELAKLAKMDVDRAEAAVQSFTSNGDLKQMREYWGAANDKAAAAVVKKHWLDENLSESADSQKLAPKISKAIIEIDDSMSYVDFAQAVAQVLRDDYGKHNYEGFINELKKNLK
jgi:hypothetical protein